jgi:hypothetical protein
VIAALALPPEARVEKRVPKKLLVEQGAPTASDKRQIQDGLQELTWIAALKPSNVGVPAFRDEEREYLEIAVLMADLRPAAKSARLIELIHRAIPYPLVLVSVQGNAITVSLAHKRRALNESETIVLDRAAIMSPPLASQPVFAPDELTAEFLASLPLFAQSRAHLCAIYQGWIECVEALLAARITGQFTRVVTSQAAAARRAALVEYDHIQNEIVSLRARAAMESQINRRVDLNLSIRRLESKVMVIMSLLNLGEAK